MKKIIEKSINRLLKDPYWVEIIYVLLKGKTDIDLNILNTMIDSRMKGIKIGFNIKKQEYAFDSIFVVIERQIKLNQLKNNKMKNDRNYTTKIS